MSGANAFASVMAALALAALSACTPPPPTNGAGSPVDPHTGVQEGGTSSSY